MTVVLDQQFVVHLYGFTEGPGARASYRALSEIWRGCRLLFGMTQPVPGLWLPDLLPASLDGLPEDGEVTIAAQERPGADCQAVLRRHHDVLNLSVALAPPEARAPDGGGWPWWRLFGRQWDSLTAEHTPHLLGEAQIYQTRIEDEPDLAAAATPLYERLSGLLPPPVRTGDGWWRGVSPAPDLAFWECGAEADDRPSRRFLLAVGPEADPVASAWAWSRGDPAIPPLARYLLHAAKLRYQLRVWRRDSQSTGLRSSLDALGGKLRQLGPDAQAEAEMLRLRRLDALLLHTDLRALRQTVEIATDNLGRAFDLTKVLVPGGPFADDTGLARSLLERLTDELAALGIAADQAEHLTNAGSRSAPRESTPGPESGTAQNVFVVHGRDEPARVAVFALLRALGLRPLEWEDLVAMTGQATPYLGEVIARSLPLARAVVVIMTPDDVVQLHPDLRPESHENRPSLQARPNVLLELGMALVVHPERTLLLVVGDQRPVSDLGGRNFIRVSGEPGFREKVALRLRLAGCPVDLGSEGWRTAGDFAALTALRREPIPLPKPDEAAPRE
ncbi:CATRA conflict system CASPASE/TPR repeat-associated protein [Herbidospora mongoliensis]|uniref:CATRA conflict system CASPASE/TPR repeat-associated protein n=1 Tax=Herbidospora mongoliensis TaxID=688067 RepID=UPI0008335E9F|nr:CATRA conflict system CASPASE/TPR repeat-associated protein [Herbidospora mongoliensis]